MFLKSGPLCSMVTCQQIWKCPNYKIYKWTKWKPKVISIIDQFNNINQDTKSQDTGRISLREVYSKFLL
jgi:hypothetical protein